MAAMFFKLVILIQATLAVAQNVSFTYNGFRSVLATVSGHGMAFVIAQKRGIPQALHNPFLGFSNPTNNGNVTNHIFAVKLDTTKQIEFNDIDNNHAGIDINGLNSVKSSTAGYYAENNGGFRNMTLTSGQAMQVWVEYDGTKK
ncbi:hypothetical protein ACFX13_009850 [Malus domestica]